MRSTVRIDDDLMVELRARALAESVSLTRMLNRTLRTGLSAAPKQASERRPFNQRTYRMGTPDVGIDKALALAAALEDEEIIRKISLRSTKPSMRSKVGYPPRSLRPCRKSPITGAHFAKFSAKPEPQAI